DDFPAHRRGARRPDRGPIRAGTRIDVHVHRPAGGSEGDRMRLLIIDDEPHIRHMMRLTLEAAGYRGDEAPDGQTGLDRFGDGSEYDAVVLDQKMPGLDGLETLRRIKEYAPDARVL